jgi:diacylglycerol kinase-like protein
MAVISSTASHPAINGCVQALPKFASAVTRNPQRVHIRCILPLGTANDFARSIGLSVEDLTAALLIVAVTATSPIDLGLFDGRPFVNMLTGGFGCQVTAETDPALKRRVGGLAYALTGLLRIGDLSASAGVFRDENFEWDGAFNARPLATAGRQAAEFSFARTPSSPAGPNDRAASSAGRAAGNVACRSTSSASIMCGLRRGSWRSSVC